VRVPFRTRKDFYEVAHKDNTISVVPQRIIICLSFTLRKAMKLSASLLIVGAGLVQAWLPTSQSHRSFTSLELSTAVSPDIYTKPEKITMDDLPTVYVYDHCPFCVRVRLALGIKNIKHKIYFMANDDVQTPTSLVGKKIAPIFVSLPLNPRDQKKIRLWLTHSLYCF
jgi:hypothetical protein